MPAPLGPPPVLAEAERLALPRPLGTYPVGRDTLHLVDRGRKDPWAPRADGRELMVSVFYPARRATGRPARYLTADEARLLVRSHHLDGVPATAVHAVRTHARTGAQPHRGRYPLVLLSPGFSLPRTTLTALAEELASRGYVAATVDHAHESVGTTFPGGREVTCAACRVVDRRGWDTVPRTRARDLSFVLDRLTGRRPAWRYAQLIDRRRVGVAGHSIGGNAAAAAMAADRRFRAGVNLDGTFFLTVPPGGLHGRPFLLLGTRSGHRPGVDASWDQAWARLDGWKRWLTVAGAEHAQFTDLPVLRAQRGDAGSGNASGGLPARRGLEITRDYVGAFFDLHLRGVAQPLLEGDVPANTEVTHERRGG